MNLDNFWVRPINTYEIPQVAELLSVSYYDDRFFKWCVENDSDRHKIVADYYKAYLYSKGCVAHVAEHTHLGIVGATVWLPHDAPMSLYEEIEKVVGINAPMFRAVEENSHMSEPPMTPFYQLVGFGVSSKLQGAGIGGKLLKYHLDILDAAGIPTYLEASTPYHGTGVYGKFGYQPVGELMVFTDNAVLYPLWRHAQTPTKAIENKIIEFGPFKWRVLDDNSDKCLLLAENVLELKEFHNIFEQTNWAKSSIRAYLNYEFLAHFTSEEQAQILATTVKNSGNPWHGTDGKADTTDQVFLLSIEEAVKYLGGNLMQTNSKFYIDNSFNRNRQAKYQNGIPTRWFLRTPGNSADFVVTVTNEGKISITGDFVNRKSTALFKVGVRPAIWIRKETN